ncbi:MAG: hypothetical protein R2862_04685 [Thermoanaerobaculia bacterium]
MARAGAAARSTDGTADAAPLLPSRSHLLRQVLAGIDQRLFNQL